VLTGCLQDFGRRTGVVPVASGPNTAGATTSTRGLPGPHARAQVSSGSPSVPRGAHEGGGLGHHSLSLVWRRDPEPCDDRIPTAAGQRAIRRRPCQPVQLLATGRIRRATGTRAHDGERLRSHPSRPRCRRSGSARASPGIVGFLGKRGASANWGMPRASRGPRVGGEASPDRGSGAADHRLVGAVPGTAHCPVRGQARTCQATARSHPSHRAFCISAGGAEAAAPGDVARARPPLAGRVPRGTEKRHVGATFGCVGRSAALVNRGEPLQPN
jgi:hypothetical protein